MIDVLSLSLHAANRFFEREVPIDALSLLQTVTPLLTDKPLKVTFREAGVTWWHAWQKMVVPDLSAHGEQKENNHESKNQ